METVKQRVFSIIAKVLGIEENAIHLEDSFVEDLNADSLDLTDLIMSLEDEFRDEFKGSSISPKAAEELRTVQDVLNFVESRQK